MNLKERTTEEYLSSSRGFSRTSRKKERKLSNLRNKNFLLLRFLTMVKRIRRGSGRFLVHKTTSSWFEPISMIRRGPRSWHAGRFVGVSGSARLDFEFESKPNQPQTKDGKSITNQ